MFAYIWPIGLVVLSNVIYHICAKSLPDNVDPFASLSITYLIAAAICVVLYFVLGKSGHNILVEYQKLNWATIIMGVVIIGLEVGFIFCYKAGWQVSMASIVQSAFLAIILIVVGYLFFKEAITFNKFLGVIICLAGLTVINWKN